MRSNVQTIDIAGGLTADSSEDSATYDDVLIEYRLSNPKENERE
jgi:hypothetical protein